MTHEANRSTQQSTLAFEQAALQASQRSRHTIVCESSHQHSETFGAARFRLDNGLRIVLMPDHRAPVLAYQTWFRVGSRDENPERTGIAHLLEHLMFKGTRKHAPGALDRAMELRGSETNAATWVDWTYYTAVFASRDDNFTTVVDFESDRMVNLILDEQTFRSELDVVKNERRMSVDDSVVGTLGEHLFALAYREHSYRWPTVGKLEHLESTTVEQVRAFYQSFYAPNNAVIVAVGAMDVTDTLTLLAEAYGDLKAQPIERPQRMAEAAPQRPRQEVLYKPIGSAQILVGYRSPPQDHKDFAAVEMLSEILGSGDSGRLYRRLVTEEQLATDVDVYLSPFAEPGLYEIFIAVRDGVDPHRALDVLQEELERLAEDITPHDIKKARNNLELAQLDELKDAEGCAEALGHHEVNYDDFSMVFQSLRRHADIGQETLARVAADLFAHATRTAVLALPDASVEVDS